MNKLWLEIEFYKNNFSDICFLRYYFVLYKDCNMVYLITALI